MPILPNSPIPSTGMAPDDPKEGCGVGNAPCTYVSNQPCECALFTLYHKCIGDKCEHYDKSSKSVYCKHTPDVPYSYCKLFSTIVCLGAYREDCKGYKPLNIRCRYAFGEDYSLCGKDITPYDKCVLTVHCSWYEALEDPLNVPLAPVSDVRGILPCIHEDIMDSGLCVYLSVRENRTIICPLPFECPEYKAIETAKPLHIGHTPCAPVSEICPSCHSDDLYIDASNKHYRICNTCGCGFGPLKDVIPCVHVFYAGTTRPLCNVNGKACVPEDITMCLEYKPVPDCPCSGCKPVEKQDDCAMCVHFSPIYPHCVSYAHRDGCTMFTSEGSK